MAGLDTTILELDHFKGLDAYASPTDVDPHYFSDLQNVDFDKDGVVSKRRGFLLVTGTTLTTALTGPVNMIFNFQSQAGFSSTTDFMRTLIVGKDQLHVVKAFGLAGETIEHTATVSNALHYATVANNGVAYLSNENGGAAPKMLLYMTGSWVFRSMELDSPSSTASMTVGTTGSLSGDYKVRYTYEDILGNESNMSPEPDAITLDGTCSGTVWTGKNLDYTVYNSADQTVTIINLYVLIPESSIYQWCCSISNSYSSTAAVTGSITYSDAWIQRGDPGPTDNWPADKAKYVTLYNDMLVTGGDPTLPDLVHVSDVGFHRQFGANNFDRVTSGDGQPVAGFGKSYNELIIAKSNSLFRATGADPETFAARAYNPEYGVLGQPSMTFFYQRLAFFSDDGVYADNALTPEEISRRIRNKLHTLNPANLNVIPPKQYAVNDKYYKRLIFAVREATGAGDNDALYVWSYERDCWTRWTGVNCTVLSCLQPYQDYQYIFGGDSAGKIFWIAPESNENNDTYAGTTTAISAYVTSPWINIPKALGIGEWDRVRTELQKIKIYAGGEPAGMASTGSITLTTNFYSDFSSTVRGTFTTTHYAEAHPSVTIDPKTFTLSGNQGTVNWFKYKIANADAGVHFKIHKIVFFFKLKPLVDK